MAGRVRFRESEINYVNYYKLESADFPYGTYDVPLPAALPEHLDYFKTNF